MTIKDLIAELQKLPADLQVILSKDAEGNGFSPLPTNFYSLGEYTPESTWSGEFQDTADPEDREPLNINAVCLWPTN